LIRRPLAVTALLAVGVSAFEAPEPPVAAKKPHDVVSPHGTRSDPYYWLRDDTRSKPEVLDYLKVYRPRFVGQFSDSIHAATC
jgi:oligopeptidase B